MTTERRAPVQGDQNNGYVAGTVDWAEHELAWLDYHARYWQQDAETIAQRGGFSFSELVDHLGHAPTTWAPNRRPEGPTP